MRRQCYITEAHNFFKQWRPVINKPSLAGAGIGNDFTSDEVISVQCFQRMGEPLNARRSNGSELKMLKVVPGSVRLAKWCKVIYKYPAIKGKHAGYKPMISMIIIYHPNACSIGVPISWQILRQEQKQQHNPTKSYNYNGKSRKHTLENKSKSTIIFLKPGFAMVNQWVGTICKMYIYIYTQNILYSI